MKKTKRYSVAIKGLGTRVVRATSLEYAKKQAKRRWGKKVKDIFWIYIG